MPAGKSFLIRRPGASSKIVRPRSERPRGTRQECDFLRSCSRGSARGLWGRLEAGRQYPLQSFLDSSTSWFKFVPAAIGESCSYEQPFELMI